MTTWDASLSGFPILLSQTARGLVTPAHRGGRAPAITTTAFVNISSISSISLAMDLFKTGIILQIISRCSQEGYQNCTKLFSYKIKNAIKINNFESLLILMQLLM
jgi:hypothetical protein